MIPTTILIPARDSAATIQRAVRSAAAQQASRVLLVDDWSSDGTAVLARSAFPRLEVIRPVEHRTLGFTRQWGLDAVDTDYVVWLDADDELLPGRVGRLVAALAETGHDFAADAVELFDGAGESMRDILAVPGFLKRDITLSRMFERNYLPAPGSIAARTTTARRIGYDTALHGAEDVDLLLRGVTAGARWCLVDEPGYRQWAYPGSLSRDLANQRRMTAAALGKHSYTDVEGYVRAGGWPERVVGWSLVSAAMFRADWDEALRRLRRLDVAGRTSPEVLEPDGPCPLPEAWRLAFHQGTVLALLGEPGDASAHLRTAFGLEPTAEAANNLGVVLAMAGDVVRAKQLFSHALKRFPAYADARANFDDPTCLRLTTHPLRRDRWRDDYAGERQRL